MESQPSPNLPVSPKSSEALSSNAAAQTKEPSVLRPTNSNTSSSNSKGGGAGAGGGIGIVSPLGGPSPTILKDPLIIDIDAKSFQQPSLAPSQASQTSREGLRRQVERRRMTLTVPERNFLDHLCVHGNEVEVQLAFERLGDDDLFFDWQTPRHLKTYYFSENQAPGEELLVDHAAVETAATPHPDDEEEDEDEEPTTTTTSSAAADDKSEDDEHNLPKLAMKRVISVGSQRRLQILEDRKTHKSPLWQAHESGIAITHTASKKSIFKRSGSQELSILSNGSAAPPQMIRDSSRFSFASTNTGSSGGGGAGEKQQQQLQQHAMDIFRRVDTTSNNHKSMRAAAGASPLQKAKYQRSKSLSAAMMGSGIGGYAAPLIPSPRVFGSSQQQRRLSTSSRKSVTFSSQTKPGTTMGKMRRSTSDFALSNLDDQSGSTLTRPPRPPTMAAAQRSDSMASIPSIHHATPLRSDSMGSIPSIHHANAIRGESTATTSSIPSIHPANAIRGESTATTSTFPSIHPANAIRGESTATTTSSTTFPSIHPANAIRGESTATTATSTTIPSIHPANPLRSNSISSIPSIRHANAVRSNSVVSTTNSIPSIRQATAIRSNSIVSSAGGRAAALRSNSISSIPSIHHAIMIRGESMSSIPSIHHANAIRGESTASATAIMPPNQLHIITNSDHDVVSGTFPTGMIDLEALDHSLMDDDDPLSPGSIASRNSSNNNKKVVLGHQNSILLPNAPPLHKNEKQQQLLPTYSATPDIATAWLNQQQGHFQSKPFDLQSHGGGSSTKDGSMVMENNQNNNNEAAYLVPPNDNQKAVLVRRASRNSPYYDGEGIEVTELMEEYGGHDGGGGGGGGSQQQQQGMVMWPSMSLRQCTSFDDETMSLYSHRQNNFDEVFRRNSGFVRRTFSDEEVVAANMMVGPDIIYREISNLTASHKREVAYADSSSDDDASWDMQSQSGEGTAGVVQGRFDSWNILKDEYVNGYGGGGSLDFMILGTCADDMAASPHVLSPPMMESLANFLPYAQSSENFFLRYSLVRDGASMLTFLKRSRGVQYGILALETVDGEVFGCFTAQPWRKSPNYFGTGESFLWRMRRSRLEATNDILEQAQLESEIDVYPFTGENQYYQLCTHDRIAVGGGTPSGEKKTCDPPINPHEWGFGLDIQGDMLVGSSSPCATFDSPSLSKVHADGSLFEIVNLELWTLTPCTSVQDAERLELGKLFLERQ